MEKDSEKIRSQIAQKVEGHVKKPNKKNQIKTLETLSKIFFQKLAMQFLSIILLIVIGLILNLTKVFNTITIGSIDIQGIQISNLTIDISAVLIIGGIISIFYVIKHADFIYKESK